MNKPISWNEYFMELAILSSKRSKDPKTQVGACIVDKDNHIVSIGYNGMPYGTFDIDSTWDDEKKHFYVVHAEANAILAKADAMKQYGDAATLQLLLDSKVLPETVQAYARPMAEALSQIDSITMYGEGNQAKLVEEIGKNGNQIFEGLNKTLGIDVKSVLAGFLGGKLLGGDKKGE